MYAVAIKRFDYSLSWYFVLAVLGLIATWPPASLCVLDATSVRCPMAKKNRESLIPLNKSTLTPPGGSNGVRKKRRNFRAHFLKRNHCLGRQNTTKRRLVVPRFRK
ncbi:hypothetical protein DPMN_190807 [Dreissena polymorpha]|uniref:Uncharacterized protein n=1 Tax=Dreissena polymorpha TaxID=45954 RepID=A0A9D3Y225_DREPO|nr:hypothetical protein DPMN_190807 [Dreissena polymorpha]